MFDLVHRFRKFEKFPKSFCYQFDHLIIYTLPYKINFTSYLLSIYFLKHIHCDLSRYFYYFYSLHTYPTITNNKIKNCCFSITKSVPSIFLFLVPTNQADKPVWIKTIAVCKTAVCTHTFIRYFLKIYSYVSRFDNEKRNLHTAESSPLYLII